jgi:tetratricopeptide (TPR) repeat protein
MALWGAEASNENDPEQAVRAGLALQRAVAEFNASTDRSLVMRVGICTGTVVLGQVATTREFTAMGDTVNVASRLEHMAPPNGVLIAHDTYRHVRGVFDVSPLDPLDVKGRTKPVRAYVVLRTKPRTFRMPTRGVEGVETRMVGRDGELEALREGFDDVTRRRNVRTMAIVGEPGVGKSRLLYEFENWVELLAQEVFYLKARALATRRNVPFGLFRDLIASRFSILDSDPPRTVAGKLHDGFSPHLAADEADLVGHWLGFDLSSSHAVRRLLGSAGFASTCASHLTRFLRSLAQEDLVLVVLEDLHWADADSLNLLDHLTQLLKDSATFFVIATRPTLLDERPNVLSGEVPCQQLQLAPLDDDTSRALILDVLQRVSALPESLVELIARRSEGNPFFVEELIKMLIDDGVIIPDESDMAWSVDLDLLEASSVPSTLTGVLEARLDSLAPAPRAALQRASVVGRVFWDAVVSDMEPSHPAIDTLEALSEACERELIYRRDQSSLAIAEEFVFKHALLRDVTYETVLLRDRQRLHALTAEWLSRHAGDRSNEFLEMIADHRRLAGDAREAAEIYHAAGRRAVDSGSSASARRLLELSVGLWTEGSTAPPAEVLLALAQACLQTGDLNAAEDVNAPLLTMGLDPTQHATALYFASWIAAERGDHDRERALLDDALPLAEAAGGTTLSRTLVGVAFAQANAQEFDQARASAARCLAVATASADQLDQGRALMALAAVTRMTGDYDESAKWTHEAITLACAMGDLEMETSARGHLGVVHHLIGDATGSIDAYLAAEGCYLAELDMSSRLGIRHQQVICHANLAQLFLRLGRPAESRPHLDLALRDALDFGRIADLGLCLVIEADLRIQSGDVDGALMLIGALQADPRAGESDRQEIERVLGRANLDDEVIDLGVQRGRGRDFVELCHTILRDRTADDGSASAQ